MKMKPEMRRSRRIPSREEFAALTQERKELAYIAGYKALIGEGFPEVPKYKAKRVRLLAGYQEDAGWTDEQVRVLQNQAQAELAKQAAE